MKRRTLLFWLPVTFFSNPSKGENATTEKIRNFTEYSTSTLVTLEPKIKYDENFWKEKLKKQSFRILFEEKTEPPFSSSLNFENRNGLYLCAACKLPLFTSDMKYDSGTGWPSFWDAITGHVNTKKDYKLILPRVEYHCAKCGGHQGHVFEDGPEPTGKRWCNNGLALIFLENDMN